MIPALAAKYDGKSSPYHPALPEHPEAEKPVADEALRAVLEEYDSNLDRAKEVWQGLLRRWSEGGGLGVDVKAAQGYASGSGGGGGAGERTPMTAPASGGLPARPVDGSSVDRARDPRLRGRG